MAIALTVDVPCDGSLDLRWTGSRAQHHSLLIERTGAVPAYTCLRLDGGTRRYRIDNLSRHQRYRLAVIATARRGEHCSDWLSVTPRRGFEAGIDQRAKGVGQQLAQVRDLVVMPQDRRLTAYWRRTPGFVDRVLLELYGEGERIAAVELEPEVNSYSFDSDRGVTLVNGREYGLRVQSRFGSVLGAAHEVLAIAAPRGTERACNAALAQSALIYPSLSLSPEVRIFEDDAAAGQGQTIGDGGGIVCYQCHGQVQWQGWKLCCSGCGTEFIPNGRGEFLDLRRLRFGTCRCCVPKKILIQSAQSQSLECVHSGKQYVRVPGQTDFVLIEDLPFGLCQCCRPRRPLVKKGDAIRCTRSDEEHRNQGGQYALVPSEPVFDATAIDDLLDAGMAEICSTGVSRGRQA